MILSCALGFIRGQRPVRGWKISGPGGTRGHARGWQPPSATHALSRSRPPPSSPNSLCATRGGSTAATEARTAAGLCAAAGLPSRTTVATAAGVRHLPVGGGGLLLPAVGVGEAAPGGSDVTLYTVLPDIGMLLKCIG